MDPAKFWTSEKDERLVEFVKNHPGLYDMKSSLFTDNSYKRAMWDEIGKTLGRTGTDMKIRWDSLKFQYRRHMAKYDTKNGQATINTPKWRLERQMSFLKDILFIDRRRSCLIPEEVVQPSVDYEFPVSSQPEAGRKRKLLEENDSALLVDYILKQKDKQENTIDLFFKMIASTVKHFSDFDQHVVKTKVFKIVNDIEAKYVSTTSSYQPSSPSPSCIQSSPAASLPSPQNSQSPYHFLNLTQSIKEEEFNQ